MRFGRAVPIALELRFPVRKSAVKKSLDAFSHLSCHFGDLGYIFRFDSRCFERPALHGLVVASLSVSRRRTAIMRLYPVPVEQYAQSAREDFEFVVLTYLRSWLTEQLEKPETAILGHEQLIVAWDGAAHIYTNVRFL